MFEGKTQIIPAICLIQRNSSAMEGSRQAPLEKLYLFLSFHRNMKTLDHMIITFLAQVKVMDLPVFFRKIIPWVIRMETSFPQDPVLYRQFPAASVAYYGF